MIKKLILNARTALRHPYRHLGANGMLEVGI